MYVRARGHQTLRSLALALHASAEVALCLCEVNAVPVVSLNGVRFVADEYRQRLAELIATWHGRPQLQMVARRRARPRRSYAPWREGRSTGDVDTDIRALRKRIARLGSPDSLRPTPPDNGPTSL
jgi:hypothetical protein